MKVMAFCFFSKYGTILSTDIKKNIMDKQNRDNINQQEERNQQPDQNDTRAEKQTPLSERISETGIDQLEEKTERVTHINESENKPGTPWSPGQASS